MDILCSQIHKFLRVDSRRYHRFNQLTYLPCQQEIDYITAQSSSLYINQSIAPVPHPLEPRFRTRYTNLLSPMGFQTETRKLKLAYDAKRSGWKPEAFHKGVDFKGPGVVVAKTKGGAVVGG